MKELSHISAAQQSIRWSAHENVSQKAVQDYEKMHPPPNYLRWLMSNIGPPY